MNQQEYNRKIKQLAAKGDFDAARKLSKQFHEADLKKKLAALSRANPQGHKADLKN